jgi:hypothetical protein
VVARHFHLAHGLAIAAALAGLWALALAEWLGDSWPLA